MAIRKTNEAQQSVPSNYFNVAELIKAYESMLLIRRFEERSAQLYGMGLIAGFCHLY
jgi:pyruvate dehydrogenase E1 component alpha subunit